MHKRVFVGITSIALVLAAVPTAAFAGENNSHLTTGEQSALEKFHSSLVGAVKGGLPEASANLNAFESLTNAQEVSLAKYLTGKLNISSTKPTNSATVTTQGGVTIAKDGDAQWISEKGEVRANIVSGGEGMQSLLRSSVKAVTYNVHSYADENFNFVGINIAKTRVWADYVTGSGVVKSIRDYGCQLVQNIDPTADVTMKKQSESLSGGKATFKCLVTSKRGLPTPWGQLTTSTRQGYQYMSVNGPGVYAHGWE